MDDQKYYFLEDVGVVVTEPLWNKVRGLYPKDYEKTKMLGCTMSDNSHTVFMEHKTLRLFRMGWGTKGNQFVVAQVFSDEAWRDTDLDDSFLYDEADFTRMEFVREVE